MRNRFQSLCSFLSKHRHQMAFLASNVFRHSSHHTQFHYWTTTTTYLLCLVLLWYIFQCLCPYDHSYELLSLSILPTVHIEWNIPCYTCWNLSDLISQEIFKKKSNPIYCTRRLPSQNTLFPSNTFTYKMSEHYLLIPHKSVARCQSWKTAII